MLTYKQLASASLVLGALFHFVFFFFYYGYGAIYDWSYFFAWIAILILGVLYLFYSWKAQISWGSGIIYRLFLLIAIVALLRSLLNVNGIKELKWLLFNSYTGMAFFPSLFFIIGCNSKYFSTINRIILVYCIMAFAVSLFYLKTFELAVFVLMPVFYLIITTPLQPKGMRVLILVISIVIILMSLTHRAGMMRIIISYLLVMVYYLILKFRINKAILSILIFIILMMPFTFLYLGTRGYNVFQDILGETTEVYSEENLRIDTRTFLYSEVLRDLKLNKALAFGKGIDGGYASESFQTDERQAIEVGFLQILLKSGIVGFLFYLVMIFSAVFKVLRKSNSVFLKCLGLLLASYFLMFFIENVFAFDFLNIITWLVIGMCHSEELIKLNDNEIKNMFIKG